jgi:hypothetical protein
MGDAGLSADCPPAATINPTLDIAYLETLTQRKGKENSHESV